MPPIIDEKKCNFCAMCVDICLTDVFKVSKKREIPEVRYPEECWHCNACVLDCKQSAISLRIPLPQMMLYIETKEKSLK